MYGHARFCRRLSSLLLPLPLLLASCAAPPRCGFWLDLYRGEPVQYGQVMEDLAGVQVVYVGERHTIDRHHQLQLAIVRDLIGRDVPVVLGLEMMEAHYQPVLDQYNRGEITFDELAQQTEWAKRWRNFADYRPMVEAAHGAGAPVLALNARAETVKHVARKGIAGLPPELRAELPEDMWLDDPMYRGHMRQVMMVHAMASPEILQTMFEAQVTRDETMADRLCQFLASEAGRGRTAVVLCGAGHVSHGMGIPARVRRRLPEVKDRIIVLTESGDVELSAAERAMAREVEISHEDLRVLDRPIADYLHALSSRE